MAIRSPMKDLGWAARAIREGRVEARQAQQIPIYSLKKDGTPGAKPMMYEDADKVDAKIAYLKSINRPEAEFVAVHPPGTTGTGKWVTIRGAHVYIGASGKIEKGPKALIGTSP